MRQERKLPVRIFVEQVLGGQEYQGSVRIGNGPEVSWTFKSKVPFDELVAMEPPSGDMDAYRREIFSLNLSVENDRSLQPEDPAWNHFLQSVLEFCLLHYSSPRIQNLGEGNFGLVQGIASFHGIGITVGRLYCPELVTTAEVVSDIERYLGQSIT